jgi:hypothetical protein
MAYKFRIYPDGAQVDHRLLQTVVRDLLHPTGKLGLEAVLTGNVKDFDYLTQIVPGSKVICYRALPAQAG